ncbi:tripartite motif-containing protein 2-like [Ptychodera flava]|uniref:tripartite motif-containing protein 2-like n=1 Tax=Ptychodera flava TaxID=63121 RepID=UPI00396A42E3
MATGETQFLEKIDENFMVCGICSERFKNAKNLPCLHSFCEECLSQLVKKTRKLECPICRRSHLVPDEGVSGIPTNFFVNELVEEFRKREGCSYQTRCEGCEEQQSVKHCIECDINLCTVCAKSHSRVRISKSHQVLTLKEYKSAKSTDPISVQGSTYCTSHEDFFIEFYCFTCDAPVCLKCTALDHRSHDYRCVKDAAKDYSKVLNEMIDKVKVKEIEIRDSKNGIASMQESLDRRSKAVEKKITTHIEKVREDLLRMVQTNGDTILTVLKDEHSTRKTELNSQMKQLDITENDLGSAREYAEKLVHYGNAAQVMAARKRVSAQMGELLKIETQIEPAVTDSLEFLPCTDFCKERSLGTLQKEDIPSYRVSATPKYVRVGDDITVTIATEGGHRLRDTVDDRNILVTMKIPDDKKVNAEVIDNKDGTLTLKSRARMEGDHEISGLIFNKPITGSPVRVKVILKKGLICKFGESGGGNGQFNFPWGVTVTRQGHALICDHSNHRLQSFTFCGKHKNTFQFTYQPNAVRPFNTAISVNGEVFITDFANKRVIVCDENGRQDRCFGKGRLKHPIGVAIHPLTGKVYVVDLKGHCIHVYNQDCSYIKSFGSNGSGYGQFKRPFCVAIDHTGKVYVSDRDNHRIQAIDDDGNFLYTFGTNGSGDGQLNSPIGVTVDNMALCMFLIITEL